MTTAETTIYFAQLDMYNWKAFVTTEGKATTVARIRQETGEVGEQGMYQVEYIRTPFARKENPAKTTRTVNSNLDTVQKRITDRGW
jgi:hypothetical protein